MKAFLSLILLFFWCSISLQAQLEERVITGNVFYKKNGPKPIEGMNIFYLKGTDKIVVPKPTTQLGEFEIQGLFVDDQITLVFAENSEIFKRRKIKHKVTNDTAGNRLSVRLKKRQPNAYLACVGGSLILAAGGFELLCKQKANDYEEALLGSSEQMDLANTANTYRRLAIISSAAGTAALLLWTRTKLKKKQEKSETSDTYSSLKPIFINHYAGIQVGLQLNF